MSTPNPKTDKPDSKTKTAKPGAKTNGASTGAIPSVDFSEFSLSDKDMVDSDMFETAISTVAVRDPDKKEFFRTCAMDGTYDRVAIVDYQGIKYLVMPNMIAPFDGMADVVQLLTCITEAGVVFLWPRKLVDRNNPNSWNVSGEKAANKSIEAWVRRQSDRAAGEYKIIVSKSTAEPQWPDKTLGDLMALAFGDNIIRDTSHDVYKHLMGK